MQVVLSRTWIVGLVKDRNGFAVIPSVSNGNPLLGTLLKIRSERIFVGRRDWLLSKLSKWYTAISIFSPYPNDGARLLSIDGFS
jgi:hypothetical protein